MSEEENINLNEITPEEIKTLLSSEEEQNREDGLQKFAELARQQMTPKGFREHLYPVLAFMAHDEDTDLLIPAGLASMKAIPGVGAVLSDDGSVFLKLLSEVIGDIGLPSAIRREALHFLVDVYCADIASKDAPECYFYRTRLFPILAAAAATTTTATTAPSAHGGNGGDDDDDDDEIVVRKEVPGLVARSVASVAETMPSVIRDLALPLLRGLSTSASFEVRNEVACALPAILEAATKANKGIKEINESDNGAETKETEKKEGEKEEETVTSACEMFLELCRDKVWNVRRACAEGLVRVAGCAPQGFVVEELAGVVRRYLNSEEEDVRWVYVATYRALGEFLSLIERAEDVPADLLTRFLAMADVDYAQRVGDSDLRLFCAYSFPGVLMKVCRADPGAWEERFRPAYGALAEDLQYKVRRSLACSIHEVAGLVPPSALAATFYALVHDIDQVRFGCLPNLARFLGCFAEPAKRKPFLVLLDECLEDDNWRTRKYIAKQIGDLVGLFPGEEYEQTVRHIHEVFFELAADPVAKVRHFAALSVNFKNIHSFNHLFTFQFNYLPYLTLPYLTIQYNSIHSYIFPFFSIHSFIHSSTFQSNYLFIFSSIN